MNKNYATKPRSKHGRTNYTQLSDAEKDVFWKNLKLLSENESIISEEGTKFDRDEAIG